MLWYGTITYKYVLYVNSCRKHKKIGAIIVRKSDAKKNIYVLSLYSIYYLQQVLFKFRARSENVYQIFFRIRLATKPECERCSRIIVVHGKIERDIGSEWIFKVNFGAKM